MKAQTHTEPAKRPSHRKAESKEPATMPKMTPWGKEVLKRIEALRTALDGKKL